MILLLPVNMDENSDPADFGGSIAKGCTGALAAFGFLLAISSLAVFLAIVMVS